MGQRSSLLTTEKELDMSAFSMRAEGGQCMADLTKIRHALSILIASGSRHELRGLPSGRQRVINGDDPDEATEIAIELSNGQVYYSLNPIRSDARSATKASVVSRHWLLIDIDATRPADTSSTNQEKAKAGEVSAAILEFLATQGWPEPLIIDSGNGWHLVFRVELDNTPLVHQIIKSAIIAIADRFDTSSATVDRKVHDAARISKLPGTWARKGTHTEDRPHRICEITYTPSEIGLVSIEQLKGLDSKPAIHSTDWSTATAINGTGLSSYIKAAIIGECGKIALSIQGTRNDALNKAAFALGTMAGWPEMSESDARSAMMQTARQVGLDERETLMTIASGWLAGGKNPRTRPLDPQRNGNHENNGKIPNKLIIFGDEVVPKKVDWMWNLRIAPGFISIFAGKTGIGKSFVLCDITARLTTGRPLPEETIAAPPCNVLFISEDPVEYVIVPRLMELKADLTRVSFMTWEAMEKYKLGDKEMLGDAYMQAKQPRLIIFDPPGNFLGGKDEHKNAEVRSVVMRLVSWLDAYHVAAVFVTHVNRRLEKGVEALDRIMGSVAWGTTARIALGFADDPRTPGIGLCAGIKNNLGPKAPTIGFEIKKTDTLATIEWKGVQDITADEAIGGGCKARRAKTPWDIAKEWMIEFLSSGRHKGDDVVNEGNINLGENHHVNWWRKAFQEIEGWDIQRSGFGEGSWWSLIRTESESANGANGANGANDANPQPN